MCEDTVSGLFTQDIKYIERHGCTADEYRRLREISREMLKAGASRDQTPLNAFRKQKRNAERRGVSWDLTLSQWWSIWQASGKWGLRGRGYGYVMCRKGDVGPYARDNVFIDTNDENVSKRKNRKTCLPKGVRRERNTYAARRMIDGKEIYLGSFPSPELAHAAYLAAGAREAI